MGLPKFGYVVSSGTINHEAPKIEDFSAKRLDEKSVRVYLHLNGKGLIYMIAEKYHNES